MASIRYNENDKFLEKICAGLNDLPLVKASKATLTLHVYGVSNEREIDMEIPRTFPNLDSLDNAVRQRGLRTERNIFWGKAEALENKVIGLGYNLRKNNPDACRRAIVMAFAALNNIAK